jgi:hypothetical protein
VQALLGAMRAAAPALIFPGDEGALRTLMRLVLDPPAGLLPQTDAGLPGAARRYVVQRFIASAWISRRRCTRRSPDARGMARSICRRGRGRGSRGFLEESYRDPGSRWPRTLPSDAPWDDPKLFAAMPWLGESVVVSAPTNYISHQ